jgi:uncharacterized protein (TIGR00297 family)
MMRPPLSIVLVAVTALAALAVAARWLTLSGSVATWIVGMIVMGVGGGYYVVPLLGFFVTSSLLSRIGRDASAPHSPARDAIQVLANGGVACAIVLAIPWAAHHEPAYIARRGLLLYLAAIATVNADTWASEIGKLARAEPRLLRTWKRVAHGTSGAVSLWGTLASLAGAAFIPLCALRLWRLDAVEFVAIAWGGFLGSLADSLLGASVQAQYRDGDTDALTDVRSSSSDRPVRGIALIDNNVVNLLASACGVLFTYILLRYAGGAMR